MNKHCMRNVNAQASCWENLGKGKQMEPRIVPGVKIEVLDREGHRSLHSRQTFEAGDVILEVRGDVIG